MSEQYWRASLENILDEIGIVLTAGQFEELVESCDSAASMQWEATGGEHIPNPIELEAKRLTKELEHERSLVHCKECAGSGRIITYGPHHGSDTECWKCRGQGKHLP